MARLSKIPKAAKIFFGLLIFYVLAMMGIALLQTKIIFQPEVLPANYSFSFTHKFEEININTGDDARLNALYFTVPEAKGVILYFHGNKGSLKRWGQIASGFTEYGYNVLVMDYRGYGKSKGQLSERALQQDARLFYEEAKHRFSEDSIVVYGRSLGTHFACLVASENHPKQLILETPYTSMTDVAKSKLPVFPMEALIRFTFDNSSLIKNVKCPVTIFHGTADRVVPYCLGKKLYEVATSAKTLITIPKGAHNNLAEYATFQQTLKKIL